MNKGLIAALVAIVVIVGGYFAYDYLVRRPADEKVQTQLTTALTYINQAQQISQQNMQVAAMDDSTLVKAMQSQGMISPTATPDSIKTVVKNFRDEQAKGTAAAFNKALKGEGKFPGLIKMSKESGAGANMATYLAGVVYYNMGNYKEAIKYLEDFDPKGDGGVSPMALSTLANCYACVKQIDKAIDTFKDAAEEADNEVMTPMFLIEAGKLLESQNKKAEAHDLYVQVKKDYPTYGLTQGGMMSSIVDEYIERTK